MKTYRKITVLLASLFFLISCTANEEVLPPPTVNTAFNRATATPETTATPALVSSGTSVESDEEEGNPEIVDDNVGEGAEANTFVITVDPTAQRRAISPLIYGVSQMEEVDVDYLTDIGATLNSWGHNQASRYNYVTGDAWNEGQEGFFRNSAAGSGGDAAVQFIEETLEANADVRLTVPTLGWMANNNDEDTCSFPLPDGTCSNAFGVTCEEPGFIADPRTTNEVSTVEMVQDWARRLVEDEGLDIDFVAMDNEPELWGETHYDVHPTCTTYEEILAKYINYATALRDILPEAQFMGPVMCCWFSYWEKSPGPTYGAYQDFLPWFLTNMREHDEDYGQRTLDVVDIRYYPQGEVFNDFTDPDTAARRLRSTKSLYDSEYVDESWISRRIYLIPRVLEIIEATYPDTPLAISEWNFGAVDTMNGALAIADVLGIFGREGVYAAAHYENPSEDSPGFYAFKMYGNYDGAGSQFGDISVQADSPDVDTVSAFAAVDSQSGELQIMLINKQPADDIAVTVALQNFSATSQSTLYQYASTNENGVSQVRIETESDSVAVTLPAYSITLIILTSDG